jgi:hypothetical protein
MLVSNYLTHKLKFKLKYNLKFILAVNTSYYSHHLTNYFMILMKNYKTTINTVSWILYKNKSLIFINN